MTIHPRLSADRELAIRLFDQLAEQSRDEPGVTRDAYGAGEQRAHDLISEEAAELGFIRAVDAAGNLLLTLPGTEPGLPAWVVGSHLDSVPHGGNFDGAAGVIAGLAAVAGLKRAGRLPRRPVIVVATRAEESNWFPASYIGSRTLLGLLPPELLDLPRSDTGRPLRDHMRELGLSPEGVAKGERLLAPERVHGFVETHIEQGPALEAEKIPLGLVTGISGSFRYRKARCLGSYGHSGAVPRRHRQDAVFAVSDLIQSLDRLWSELDGAGRAATITFGEVFTDASQHGFSKIPGELNFCLDVRSADRDLLDDIHARLMAFVAEIETRRGVRFALGERTGSQPAVMSAELLRQLGSIADRLGIPHLSMPSGAGHDAAVFANASIPSIMLFVRNQNGSHNPHEAMRIEDFHAVATVLTHLILE
ncbi:hydantoinase/carbamoylase family amidase [Bradyrhizobium manausense]|uniref:Zn-dependent hydrolase n=1 Tax=Bradyrhizobium TaxID=374 RepID=UPI001BA465FF|nr:MULTISPECIES: Zn-dependent hydrolase [Bradyrhizobium]MBR0827725.1 hydantoinase/carbamoylase family amidase [Bradyrhizobium manausense]UVO26199.1 hydantoinase/carbamoylase family amidase [Bradyrhizobium arachidis]